MNLSIQHLLINHRTIDYLAYRRWSVIFSFLFLFGTGWGQLPFSENFDGTCGTTPPVGWSDTGADPFVFNAPNHSAGADHTSGSGCFAAHDDSADDGNGQLETPTLNLSSYSAVQLSFWGWNDENSGNPLSQLHVDVSTNGGSTFTNDVGVYSGSYQSWTQFTLNISTYISNQTVVRFRTAETNSFYSDFSIDDVLIESTCSAPTVASYTVVPNCSTNFTIDVNVTSLGDGSAVDISDGGETAGLTNVGTGTHALGPYAPGTNVTITVDGSGYGGCAATPDGPHTEDCACTTTPTATVNATNLNCGTGMYDIEVTVVSDGDGDVNMSDVYIDDVLQQVDVTTGMMNTYTVTTGAHTVTIEAEGAGFVTCTSIDYNEAMFCNGGDVCADAVDILGTSSSANLSLATLDAPAGLLPCFETMGNGNTMGRGNCSGAGCFEHSAYWYTEYEDLWYSIDLPDGSDEFTVTFTGLSCAVAVFPYTGSCGSLSLMSITGGVGTGLADSDNDGNVETEANDNPIINTDGVIHFKGTEVATASTGTIYLRVFAHDDLASGTACNSADIIDCDFTIAVSSPQANDVCGDALDIDDMTQSGDLCAASVDSEGNETGATCGESQDANDLWYEVTMDGADADQFLEVDLTFTGAADAVVVELYSACFSNTFVECATVSSTGAGSTVTHVFTNTITAGGFGPEWLVRVTPVSGNGVCSFSILGRRIAENNTCEVFQSGTIDFNISSNNNLNFNFATDSGSDPVVAGSDLWFQFDPVTGDADGYGFTTASTTADIIIGGLTGDQQVSLILYKGNGVSANNCLDLSGDYLETISGLGNGTVTLSCLDELHTAVDGGYILRVIQTAGSSTIDNGLIRAEPNPAGPYNNDCENIWDGNSPSNLGVGDASTHFNPYFIPSGDFRTGDFENTTDCHPDISSAVCSGIDRAAISEVDDRDAWFTFQVPATAGTCDLTTSTIVNSMVLTYNAGSAFNDGALFVYSDCGDANLVDCSPVLDGAAPGTEWTVNGLTQGDFYTVRVKPALTNTDFEYSFDITVEDGPVSPCNDRVDAAEGLTIMNSGFDRANSCATQTPYSAQGATESSAVGGGNDVWFSFTAPDNGGPYVTQEGWVTLWFESVSGHPLNLEVYDEGLGDVATSRIAGPELTSNEGYLHVGHLNPGETYWVRLDHNQIASVDVQYRICAYYNDNFGACPMDGGPTSLTPQECSDDCEAWFQIDLPEGLASAFYRVEVVGDAEDHNLHLWFQGDDSPSGEGTSTDYDHPCNQFGVGRLTATASGVLTDADVSENCNGGNGVYKVYNLIGPTFGQRNYYNIEIEDQTLSTGCDGLDICRVNVKGPYNTSAEAEADGSTAPNFCGSFDYGDLPTSGGFSFPTAKAFFYDTNNNGVPDDASAVWLGAFVDGESVNSGTSEAAVGDDGDGMDDEDGYAVGDVSTVGVGAGTINVTVNGGSSGLTVHVGMWIDWLRTGDLSTADFYAFSGVTGSPVTIPVSVDVPVGFDVATDPGFVRLIASTSPVAAGDFASDIVNGEIEDHLVIPVLLPIELISFTADVQSDHTVKLEWSTATEINNDYFILEKSTDGQSYRHVAQIDGQGNSASISDYSFIDTEAQFGTIYYRLSQVDFDGTTTYMPIRSVHIDRQPGESYGNFKIYPNPVVDQMEVHYQNQEIGDYLIEINDMKGRLVHSERLSLDTANGSSMMNLNRLTDGVYLINIIGDKSLNQIRIVKTDQ